MPLVLTEVANYDPTVTVPVDGDVRNAASVQTPLQNLTNRAAFFNAQIGAAGGGAKKVRTVTSVAALKALLGMADGEAAITNGGFPYASNLWLYSIGGADTEFLPWIVAPNSGPGRWYNALQSNVNLAGGASGTAARWTVPVPNAFPSLPYKTIVTGTTYNQTPNGANVDSGFASNPIALQAGDVVEVDVSSTLQNTSGTTASVRAQLATFDGTTTTDIAESQQTFSQAAGAVGAVPLHMTTTYVAPSAVALFSVKVRLFCSAGAGQVGLVAPHCAVIKVIRP